MLEHVLPINDEPYLSYVILTGIGTGCPSVPLKQVELKSDLVTGSVSVGIVPHLPIKGIDLLLGNDLAGSKVIAVPQLLVNPSFDSEDELGDKYPNLFPSCVVTRSMKKKTDDQINLRDTFLMDDMSDIRDQKCC
jgi:hypothetical protein